MRILSPVTIRASLLAAGSADAEVAYISLPPGSAPNGESARIFNLRTGDSIVVAVAQGGFDPAAIVASAGDSIGVVVRDAAGNVVLQPPVFVVSARRPPVVVRTYPPPGKRDVALNSRLAVVFSEPIDSTTLTANSVQLRHGSTVVSGHAEFRDSEHVAVVFVPSEALLPATQYTLAVSQEIRDLDGEVLESPVSVEFTTATSGAYEEYFIDELGGFITESRDTVVIRETVRVFDGNGVGIEGAVIHFRGSVGTVRPDTTTTGLGGLVTHEWRFRGTVGFLPAPATAELLGCASTSATRCDMYWTLLLVGYTPL